MKKYNEKKAKASRDLVESVLNDEINDELNRCMGTTIITVGEPELDDNLDVYIHVEVVYYDHNDEHQGNYYVWTPDRGHIEPAVTLGAIVGDVISDVQYITMREW